MSPGEGECPSNGPEAQRATKRCPSQATENDKVEFWEWGRPIPWQSPHKAEKAFKELSDIYACWDFFQLR